jgi:small subunit ribosomal protein S17
MAEHIGKKRILEGIVISDKMAKTIVVKVERLRFHPMYDKPLRSFKKYKAHDEKKAAKVGDRVRIIESRPISKEKRHRLLEVIK